MPPALKVSNVQSRLAGIVRDEVQAASGKDGRVGTRERKALSPYARTVVDTFNGSPRVNAVVDRAMFQAMAAVSAENQASGPGKAFLSQAELRRIAANDPDLGDMIGLAGEQIRSGTTTPVGGGPGTAVTLEIVSPLAGTLLGVNDTDVYTLFVDPAQVANGTDIKLKLDGHILELRRLAGGVSAYPLVTPQGYGIEQVGQTADADGMSITLRIKKDPPNALSEGEAKQKAKTGLIDYLKNTRIHQSDWQDYFPATWQGCVDAGVPSHIDRFLADPETQVIRQPDTLVFVGRGPFDLYTEVSVDKVTGDIANAYLEID